MTPRWFMLVAVLLTLLFLPAATRNALSAPETPDAGTALALPGGLVVSSSPALADLDGDNVPEVIVGTTRFNAGSSAFDRPAMLVAMKGNGQLLWARDVGAPINSTPAIGDINRDGQPDIVVGIGADLTDMQHEGGVVAYDRHGNRLWHFLTDDFNPASGTQDGWSEGVFASPSLCDVDRDGDLEIAFGSWDQRIYLLDHNGNSLWNNVPNGWPGRGFMNGDTVWSSPACSDLNGDGYNEIITGADISAGGILPDGTVPSDGGYLYIFDRHGQVLVRRHVPEAIYSSPAVGDLNGDGRPEIVVGTSYSFWLMGRSPQPYVYAFDTAQVFGSRHYSDAAKLPDLAGWPRATVYPGYSSPALADLDNDGDLEVIIGSGNPAGASDQCSNSPSNPNCYGAVYAWHHNGAAVGGFPMWPKDFLNKNAFVRSSPTVADLDGDGTLEILVSMLWDVVVIGHTGQQERTLHTTWTVEASPAVDDTNGDGRVEVWIGGGNFDNRPSGHLWRFDQTGADSATTPWRMFRHDGRHTAAYGSMSALDAEAVSVIHTEGRGDFATASLTLQGLGDAAIQWQVASVPSRVQVTPSSGTLAVYGSATLSVRLDARNLPLGSHGLGNIVISGTNTQTGAPVPSIQVPVTLQIARYVLFLPAVND